ncbi:Pycsar system effector family protein [Streptomyces sp. NPDC002785]|uniref:Pycsar system effector family protein n=1 Tax=Streptomyces sp. NPDC002785 TaxID=3154543 RepID=UPI00332DADC8
MTTTGPATGSEAATRLLAELRSEIARADSKANVLVAAIGTTAGAASGLFAGRGWRPSTLSTTGAVFWWSGTAALAAALVALLMVVVPRYRTSKWTPGAPLSYFGDIQQAVQQEQLAQALAETERDPSASLMAALAENSRIAALKHQWIRRGLLAFCVGMTLLPASVLID